MVGHTFTPEGKWCFGPNETRSCDGHEYTYTPFSDASLVTSIWGAWLICDGVAPEDHFKLRAVEFWPVISTNVLHTPSRAFGALPHDGSEKRV